MSKRKSVDLLPVIFRTEANERFLTGTIDQLIQKPTLKKVDGFIGDKTVPNYNPGNDSYINEGTSLRDSYELEPGIVIRNSITEEVEYAKTYEDILNSLKYLGTNISNQDKMFRQQSYAWNPLFDLDKFVNYRNYVWMPSGPLAIRVTGREKEVTSTIRVSIKEGSDGKYWSLSTNSVAVNPTITLYRGMTYIFDVSSVDQPFYIKNKRSSGDVDAWPNVVNNGATSGQVIFTVTENTPGTLFYVSGANNEIFGKLLVRNQKENYELDVDSEIVGKKTYAIKDGVQLSNGMKVTFADTVTPEFYRGKTFIVEGVGESIKLIDFEKLVTIEEYSTVVETSFDSDSFDELPFDEVSEYPITPDYILINRSSNDLNPWSRYNRWFHIDVVTVSAELNNVEPNFSATDRAQRPIIEFKPNIQLFNFANVSKYVNYLDDTVTDAFSNIEGSLGYFIDGKSLEHGNRIVFTSEKDTDVRNKIYEVQFLDIEGVKKIHLELTSDAISSEGDGLLVLSGNSNGRSSWVYKNGSWVKSQQKDGVNKAPLFDVYDADGVSYSDPTTYKNNDFAGCKIFSYQVGTGANDSVLGFPLSYGNVANVGGYLFESCLFTDTFQYFDNGTLKTVETNIGYLKQDEQFINGWTKCNKQSIQEIIDQKVAIGGETAFEFNAIDIRTTKDQVRLFKNGDLLPVTAFDIAIDTAFNSFFVNFTTALVKDDVITIKALPVYNKRDEGYYEAPINLVNNPLNDFPVSLSYAEINDHLNTILLNGTRDLGFTLNQSNLRDNLDVEKYGRRFVQHEGLVSLAGALLTSKDYNFMNAIRWGALEYQRYKILVLQKFANLNSYNNVSDALDEIILDIGKDKTPLSTFYFSDMVPYGLNKRQYEYTITSANITAYAYGSEVFDRYKLDNRAVLVYLNGKQLVIDKDYYFDLINPLVRFKTAIAVGDKIVIKVYQNIYGSMMPMSPTKLGLYPSFEPAIYTDDTFLEPTDVIQGHDGSITVCYGDDRDALLLELETRIYNNLKVSYDPRIMDINDALPGMFRKTAHSVEQIDNSIRQEFLRWTGLYNIDYESNDNAQYEDNFSFKYVNGTSILDESVVITGSWRKLYKFYFDTDRPHTHPWEMLGFYMKPTWWEAEYGPAPYTSGNAVLWADLESGYIRAGDRQGYDSKYARPGLSTIIPVDTYGELRDPVEVNVVKNYVFADRYSDWKFGDVGPAESAWRRSHLYPFAVQIAMALNIPAKYFTLGFDTSRNTFNRANQIVYANTQQRISPVDLIVYNDTLNGSLVTATGYHPYIVEHLRMRVSNPSAMLASYLNRLESNLIYKVGGFTSKDKFRIALETVTNYKTVDKVFIPEENYQLTLNVSSPVKTLSMSGIIVERSDRGYIIKGYDSNSPYFTIFKALHKPNDPLVSVGGTSEPFVYWAPNAIINGGTVVANGQRYFRAIADHITKDSFDSSLYYPLPYLPQVGGVEVAIPQNFDDNEAIVPYGTVMNSTQDIYDFIVGYGKYVESLGFVFDHVLSDLDVVANWELAGKEFLFWSLQNWATSSIISLAPFAARVKFVSTDSVVDDVYDTFYDYTLLKSDGTSIDKNKLSVVREEGLFVIGTDNIPNDGVYYAKITLVQKEHVVVFDNKTMFSDLIYEPVSGYRQRRFRVTGFMTDGWQGDFYIPGFVYDSAKIEDWEPNVDYDIGNVVRFQTQYYQAARNLVATTSFNYEDWSLLGKQPVAQLLPNFEYKISQFEEFYSLDSVNFDNGQQKYAQKLIGYIPRSYLSSLIPDEASQYKFYQGFIREKGTTQALEKFSVANNASTGSHIELQEEWAIRLGMFGGEQAYKELEFTLDQNRFNQDPQLFEFDTGTTPSGTAYVIPSDHVLIKPQGFDGYPWPTLDTSSATGNGYKQYQKIPTAGYVRIDDVSFTGLYEDNILSLSSQAALREGDTIWIAMDTKGDWTVKRYTICPATIINYTVDNANNLISFNTDIAHNLELRDFVAVSRLDDPLNGIYEVIGVPTSTSFVVKTSYNDIAEPTDILSGSIFTFKTSRFATLDKIADVNGLARWQNCEYVWVDDVGDGTWGVFEKEDCTSATPLRPYIQQAHQQFGTEVVIAPNSKNIIVSATELERGRIYVYERSVLGSDQIVLRQSYLLEENISDELTVQNVKNGVIVEEMPRNHGTSVDCWESTDLLARYIVSGAPNSANAKWLTNGVNATTPRKVLDYNFGLSNLTDEGVIKITKFDAESELYETDVVLASPRAQNGALFGHKVKFVGNTAPTLLVSAPGEDTGIGAVFVYYLDTNNVWQVFTDVNSAYNLRSKITSINVNANFGWDIAATKDGKTVVISAPGYIKDRTQVHSGAVFVFTKDAGTYGYNLTQSIYADDYLQGKDLILKGTVKTYDTNNQLLTFEASTNSLVRNFGNFIDDGFRIGQTILITGSVSNNHEFVISELSATRMTFKPLIAVVQEVASTPITITGQGTLRKDRFGDKVAISADGNTLIISSDHASQTKLDAGLVYVLEKTSAGQYVLNQRIPSPSIETGELFGSNVALSPDGSTLLVTAIGGNQDVTVAFDTYTERYANSTELYGSEYVLNPNSSIRPLRTTFDNNSTRFISGASASGAVYMFQKMGSKYVFGQSLISGDSATADGYGTGIATDGQFCLVGAPKYDLKVISSVDATNQLIQYPNSGTVVVYDYTQNAGELRSWKKVRAQTPLVDVDKITKVFTYNNDTLEIIENYEVYDPVKGKIPAKVMEEIKYMTPFDPAVYTIAVQTSNKVRVDNKTTWTEDHVGEVWLDTSTMRYVWYEQGTPEFRNNNWGKLFPGSTVDVYEWVKSDYRPSEWAQLADTSEGLALGISGQPKNPDNTVVSINQYFDPVINDFVNVYYFWVRNKITVPDLEFRSISTFDCSRIIEDPKTQGIKYVAFLSPKALSVANTKKDLKASKINIDIYFHSTDTEVSRHSHWQLINGNTAYLHVDPTVETKLIDSLVGLDKYGNTVPDPNLSPKLKYGNNFTPRQSWFIDKELALKTMLTYTNDILKKYDIVGKVHLDTINVVDEAPQISLGFYDEVVDMSSDIVGIGTNGKVQAELSATVANGKLVSVAITNPGNGYKIAPTVKVYGSGNGAKVQTAIDLSGKVVSVKIINQGYGYETEPRLYVRPYAVLANIDEEINKWSIFHYADGEFNREVSQTYDVTKYWDYIDWVDGSYDVNIPPKYSLNFLSDLELVSYVVGDTVEIRTTGDGHRIILRKTAANAGNYLNDYDLIYREKGTIEFSSKLYDKVSAGIGYDSSIRYDQSGFDETNYAELRIILDALKDSIFVGDLAVYWSKFVFVAIRHVLHEQVFVDWVFKTSFITPVIDAGTLDQDEVYRFNDFGYVEDFIKEIKPYKSKFREVTVKYENVETANIGVTDFDLPSYVDPNTGMITIPSESVVSSQYPFKHWSDNHTFSVTGITIGATGANYIVPPVVTIIPQADDYGTGATAIAKISEGKLSSIEVTNPGTGYLKTPTVVLSGGGNYTAGFVPGTAYAMISNSKVRNSLVQFKFDRVSEKGLFTGEVANRVITTDGTTLNYVLAYPSYSGDNNYPALQDEETIRLFLNDAAVSSDNYRITFRNDLSTVITFNVALPANQQLRIQYIKNTLYTVDTFTQSSTGATYLDTFKLTYPPELDNQKIIVKLINTSTGLGSEIFSNDYILQVKQVKENGFTKYVGYIKFKNIPTPGSVITVQYAKNINIQNAVDRIISSYYPTAGMPGKDVTQLIKGVEFGGVEIEGLNFSVSSGWDGLPWFTQGWDTFVNEYKDLLVISNGTTDTYDLGYIPLVGTMINVYFDGVRVDDEYFGTVDQVNKQALFKTIVANGSANTITLPSVPAEGVKIEIRQSLSDGVNLPTDDYVLDTNLSGGDFSIIYDAGETRFRTATGVRPDDISVDGGQFLSVEHSPATEELVKGEIFDTLSISVFNSPGTGSNVINTYQFMMDGTSTAFTIKGVPDNNQQLDVYVGNFYVARDEFTITVNQDNTTTINITTTEYGISDASVDNKIVVTIQKVNIGGEKILARINHIVTSAEATANTIEIDTPVNIADIGTFYTSTSKSTSLAKLTSKSKRAKVVISNTAPKISAGTAINILLFSSDVITYSEVYNQEIVVDTNTTYTLQRPPGNIAPLHVMAAVTRLTPSNMNWRDSWQENVAYALHDTVLYMNVAYECKLAHVSISQGSTIQFPSWAMTTHYNVGDIVNFQTKTYICKVGHTSNGNDLIPTNITYWAEHVANRPDQDTGHVFWQAVPTQRMLPPETEYYDVTQNAQTFRLGDNIPYLTRTLSISDIEVYKNGKILVTGQDFEFDNVQNTVTMSSGVTQVGDVVAVCVLKNADYVINNTSISFTPLAKLQVGQRINVTTYTNHDQNLMRREVFKTSPFKHDYKLSRPVYDIDNIWADLNGRPLIPNVDFKVSDYNYIDLSSKFDLTDTDRLVVTSISDIVSSDPIAFRMFKDMTNGVQFKRLSKSGSVTLTKELLPTDREIEVSDVTMFGVVDVKNPKPSVVYIAGERIEFRSIIGNRLGNLTRGTLGTGTADSYPVGTKVFNFGQSETIPYREGYTINTFSTVEGYQFNQATNTYQQYVNNAWTDVDNVFSVVLTDFMFNDAIAYEDQVSVFMAGKQLTKPVKSNNGLVKHDFSITLNSGEVNSLGETGDIEIEPDFTIVKDGSNYVLTVNPNALNFDSSYQLIPNVEVRVLQKIGKIWYTLNGAQTMQTESTAQAKFLQESPAELPDKYYYGKTS